MTGYYLESLLKENKIIYEELGVWFKKPLKSARQYGYDLCHREKIKNTLLPRVLAFLESKKIGYESEKVTNLNDDVPVLNEESTDYQLKSNPQKNAMRRTKEESMNYALEEMAYAQRLNAEAHLKDSRSIERLLDMIENNGQLGKEKVG